MKLSYPLTLSFSDCDKALFQNTIQLREKRVDIQEALTKEKRVAANLRKEYNVLVKKVWYCCLLRKHQLAPVQWKCCAIDFG